MTVVDLVRQYLKVKTDISDADLWVLVQQIAESLGIDVNAIDDAYGQLIADEIDKTGGGLSVTENNSLSIVEEPKNGKKNKRNTPATTNNSDPIERLIPVIKNLHTTVSTQTGAMKDIVRRKVEETKNLEVEELLALTDGINEEILLDFTKGLEARSQETKSFLDRFEKAFDEAWG